MAAPKKTSPLARFVATTEAVHLVYRLLGERGLDWRIRVNPFPDEVEKDEDHIFIYDETGDIGPVCLAAGGNGYRLEVDGRIQFENGVLWNSEAPAHRFVEAMLESKVSALTM